MVIGYPVRASGVDEIFCSGLQEKQSFLLLKVLDETLASYGWCGVRTWGLVSMVVFPFIRNVYVYRTRCWLEPLGNLVGGRFEVMSSELLEEACLAKWATKLPFPVLCLKTSFNCFLEHSNIEPFLLRICWGISSKIFPTPYDCWVLAPMGPGTLPPFGCGRWIQSMAPREPERNSGLEEIDLSYYLSVYPHLHTNMLIDTVFGLPSDPYSEYEYGTSIVCSNKPHFYTFSFFKMSSGLICDINSMFGHVMCLCVCMYDCTFVYGKG